MTVRWMCLTCGEGIEESAVDDHEAEGHDVKAHVVPTVCSRTIRGSWVRNH